MSNTAIQKAMENAEASINMEGLYVSDLCKELCEKLLKKEITFPNTAKRWIAFASPLQARPARSENSITLWPSLPSRIMQSPRVKPRFPMFGLNTAQGA